MEHVAHAFESVSPQIPLEVFIPGRQIISRTLTGVAASPGVIEGPCTIIRDLRDLHHLPHGAILACQAALPTLLPFLPSLRGLVAERGGTLSYSSRYANAYGVPAVLGVEGLMGAIQNGDVIRVDGSTGTVDIMA